MKEEALIPDFDSMIELVEELGRVRAELAVKKSELDIFRAECMARAKTDESLWIKNKPPTDTYCKATVSIIGNSPSDKEHIVELTRQIADLTYQYTLLRETIQLKRDQLDLYRTMSANSRKGFLNG